MINLEQVKLLEAKVTKAIEYVERLTKENTDLRRQEAELRQKDTELLTKLEAYQKRIDELEVLVTDFKDDQGRIEESILSALDRLSQFEKAMEKTLRNKSAKAAKETADAASEAVADNDSEGQTCFEIPEAALAAAALTAATETAAASDGELDIF